MRVAILASACLALAAASPSQAGEPLRSSEIAIGETGRQLHGTLLQPGTAAANMEPVLILAGSGPTDRDGNSPVGVTAASYRLLAEALAALGVTSLRVDKRGIAASAGAATAEQDLRLETFANDARAWAAQLKRSSGARCIWLLGHSEGTLHAMVAGQGNEDVCGLILVSPVGRRLSDVIREQLRANPANAPILEGALSTLADLDAGRTVPADRIHPALAPLFRPSVQPLLISMFAHDPADLVRRFRGPVLVVQGTTDIQTAVADAERLGAARPGVQVRIIEGMNHVLKIAPADRAANIATYADAALPLAPGLAEAIADFIMAN